EREQAAPLAGASEAEGEAGQGEAEVRARPAEAEQERCDAELAEAERKDVEHRRARYHEQHLIEECDHGRRQRRRLAPKQREAAEIDGHDRERAEQRARIAPAERVVAEDMDRDRKSVV